MQWFFIFNRILYRQKRNAKQDEENKEVQEIGICLIDFFVSFFEISFLFFCSERSHLSL